MAISHRTSQLIAKRRYFIFILVRWNEKRCIFSSNSQIILFAMLTVPFASLYFIYFPIFIFLIYFPLFCYLGMHMKMAAS